MMIGVREWMRGLALVAAMAAGVTVVGDEGAVPATTSQPVRDAINRALSFLETDAFTWRNEHECATCHHGTMTVWVHCEARSQGYDLSEETVADLLEWAKARALERVDLPRDERPGFKMVSTPNIYLAMMARCIPEQEAVSQEDLRRIGGHFLRHQEADGSWAWSSAPAQNRAPPVFESDEVATLLTSLALEPQLSWNQMDAEAIHGSLDKASAWLTTTTPTSTTQAMLLRLLRSVWSGAPTDRMQSETSHILLIQNDDGGWGQMPGAASDAYATGQALYFLRLAGVSGEQEEMRRAAAFLVSTQNEDGSWTMTPRAHPEATPSTYTVPITYFGSAWATLGLLRATGPLPATGE